MWLYTIARNACAKALRDKEHANIDDYENIVSYSDDPFAGSFGDIPALKILKDDEVQIVSLHIFAGLRLADMDGVMIDGEYISTGECAEGIENSVKNDATGDSAVSTAPNDEDAVSGAEWASTLHLLRANAYYGELKLTNKNESAVDNLLASDFDINYIYEDDEYLYSFNPDESVSEIVILADSATKGNADRSQIEAAVEQCFERYLLWEDMSEYEIEIDENKDAYPAWTVNAKKYDGEICVSRVLITFDEGGKMLLFEPALVKPIITGNIEEEVYTGALAESISNDQAVNIALAEAGKEEYGLIISEDRNVSIETRDGCYRVILDPLYLKASPRDSIGLIVVIDIKTGEVVDVIESMIKAGVEMPPDE